MRSHRIFRSAAGLLVFFAALGLLVAKDPETAKPRLQPLPAETPAPRDNPTTAAKAELGRLLFFDPRLSGDNQMSCASCHAPEKGFGDGLPRSRGAGEKLLARNSPTLLNVGLHTRLFWDGRAGSLEEQALGPIESPDEMNQNLDELVTELTAVAEYRRRFDEAFGKSQPSITPQRIAQALAAFERTLTAPNAPLDRYLAGDKQALSPLAKEGMELFTGAAGCIRCHHGPLLSDGEFYRLGVGRDLGRGEVTGEGKDRFKFRTPSLRNIAETGPYMHDGSERTLYDVVEFYYRRAPRRGPEGLPIEVQPLVGQSYSEIDAIVAFLKAASGEPPQVKRPELP